jgi:type II secretory pathway component PulF
MPSYQYKAKEGPAKTVEGEIMAATEAAAMRAIEEMGLSPISVREGASPTKRKERRRLFVRRVSNRDITVFTNQLASLTRSAVPILRALRTIAGQTENPRLARVVEDLNALVRDGRMLSEAMARYPKLFPDLYINMIRAGESGGVLDTVLDRLSEAREKEEDTRRRVQAAMAYPMLTLCAGLATVFALFAFFLPRVVTLFEDYEMLPLPTRILIGISEFFDDSWYWLVLALLLASAVFRRLAGMEAGRLFADRLKLGIPLLNRFLREVDVARFSRTLSLLIDTGIPIDRALTLSGQTIHNAVIRAEVDQIRASTVQQGLTISSGLRKAENFPEFVGNLVAVGEEGGRLPEALTEVAVFYEKDVEQQSRLITSLLEPILILLVGGVVGFIVAAMLLPIFELGGGLR